MRAAFDVGLARRLADHWGHQGGVPVRAEDENETRDGTTVGARSNGTDVAVRFHAAAEVRGRLVGARGLEAEVTSEPRARRSVVA